MRVRVLVAALAAGLVVGMTPSPAGAQAVDDTSGEALVTADLNTTGSRSITVVAPITFSGALSSAVTSTYSVEVVEALRTGTNPWSVTGRICGETSLLPDCATKPNQLNSGANTLASSNIAASAQAVAELLAGGSGDLTAGTFADFGATRTLFSNANQSTAVAYSETYTATGNLSLTAPNGTPTGSYTGYFVVDLVQ